MQKHPRHPLARALRAARAFSSVRGFASIAERYGAADAPFIVNNGREIFAGNLSSYIDRQVYMLGGYERSQIEAFLGLVPRKRIALDVGANAGTHTIAFGHAFEKVHSFEPNARMWAQLERNVSLNDIVATVHRIGLSDCESELPFYDIGKDNGGLGTFSTVEQYDRPLRQIAVAAIRIFDRLAIAGPIDAVKIDVQGLEPAVLRGMQTMLRRDKPTLWVEIGAGTGIDNGAALEALIPYPVKLMHLEAKSGLVHRYSLRELGDKTARGDIFAMPI